LNASMCPKGGPLARSSGSGLGLAIVRELVHAMGGTVSAESVVGEATKLTITVPALS
jgi:signal transduction histidine kinase